jgi:hypothetical protein
VSAEARVPFHHDGMTGNNADVGEVMLAVSRKQLHFIVLVHSLPSTFSGNRQ